MPRNATSDLRSFELQASRQLPIAAVSSTGSGNQMVPLGISFREVLRPLDHQSLPPLKEVDSHVDSLDAVRVGVS